MDLPTCPTCGQSVIDDEADECPFCGSPMKGGAAPKKPAAGASAGKPAKPAPPAKPAGGKPSVGKPSAGKPSKSPAAGQGKPAAAQSKPSSSSPAAPVDPDDPFAVDTSAHKDVPQATPKPSKARLYKVVCPMCETVGFVPKKAAGHDVRCANKECLVPIFKAPAADDGKDKSDDDADGGKGGLPKPVLIGGGLVLIVAVGVGAVMMMPGDDPRIDGSGGIVGGNMVEPEDDSDPNGELDVTTKDDGPETQKLPLAQIQKLALEKMIIVSRQRDRNRSKAFCRQLTAEAFAYQGDADQARAEMDQLAVVERRLIYYRIRPLVVLAWHQLNAGDKAAATKSVLEAQQYVKVLPRVSRTAVDLTTELASALVAIGKVNDARNLLSTSRSLVPADAYLSADLHVIRAFEAVNRPAMQLAQFKPWSQPQHVAVAAELAIRGNIEELNQWMASLSSDLTKAEAGAAAAQVLGQVAQLSGTTADLSVLKVLPQDPLAKSAAESWWQAAAAAGVHAAGGIEPAQQLITAAQTGFEAIPDPEPYDVPKTRQLLQTRFDLPDGPIAAVLAGAQLSQSSALTGQTDAAWKALERAMGYARSATPSPAVAKQYLDQAEGLGSALPAQMKRLLGITDQIEARRAARNYENKCEDMVKAADRRFELQLQVLRNAADWGLHQQIWDWAQKQHSHRSIRLREEYLESPLPWYIHLAYKQAGDPDGAKQVVAKFRAVKANFDSSDYPEDLLRIAVTNDINNGKYRAAGAKLDSQQRVPMSQRVRYSQKVLDSILDSGELDHAIQFVAGVKDALWREAALSYIASRATAMGNADEVWKHSNNRDWSATEQVAWMRGLTVRIAVLESNPNTSPTASATTTAGAE